MLCLSASLFARSVSARAISAPALHQLARPLHTSVIAQTRAPTPTHNKSSRRKLLDPPGKIATVSTPKRHCAICSHQLELDYKNVQLLSQFVSPTSGMILPRRLTGTCAKQQRKLAVAIKRSRSLGFMPYVSKMKQYEHDKPIWRS